MNKYVRKLFGSMFRSQQTRQVVHIQSQSPPTSPQEWETYWNERGQSWRYEAEIDLKRQEELSKRRTIVPDVEKGIYPFKGMKLSRADVEWLLATYENGRGPVLWDEEKDKPTYERRRGLDLRGADLREVELAGLPLAGMCGGLTPEGLTSERWHGLTKEQRKMAAVLLEKANLAGAHLQRADLWDAQLQGADLRWADLEKADLRGAQLQGAVLEGAQLQGAFLLGVQLPTNCATRL